MEADNLARLVCISGWSSGWQWDGWWNTWLQVMWVSRWYYAAHGLRMKGRVKKIDRHYCWNSRFWTDTNLKFSSFNMFVWNFLFHQTIRLWSVAWRQCNLVLQKVKILLWSIILIYKIYELYIMLTGEKALLAKHYFIILLLF